MMPYDKKICDDIVQSVELLKHSDKNELLSSQQAAALINVTSGTLSVWRSTGRYGIPFIKIGRKVRYRKSDLIAWLDSRTHSFGESA
jgi:excisionase family DNA binding protein